MKPAIKYIGLISAMFAAALPALAKDIQTSAEVPKSTPTLKNVDRIARDRPRYRTRCGSLPSRRLKRRASTGP
jgi:hypothetical protein